MPAILTGDDESTRLSSEVEYPERAESCCALAVCNTVGASQGGGSPETAFPQRHDRIIRRACYGRVVGHGRTTTPQRTMTNLYLRTIYAALAGALGLFAVILHPRLDTRLLARLGIFPDTHGLDDARHDLYGAQ